MTEDESVWEAETSTVAGRCLCSRVRFELSGYRSRSMAICHCSRCRKMTGAAYVHFMAFSSPQLLSYQGAEHLAHFDGTQGTPEHESQPIRATTFCSVCGSSMPSPMEGSPEYQGVLAGNVLDMPPHMDSSFHFYTKSKCPWVSIPSDEPQAETVKEGYHDPDQPDLKRHLEADRVTGSCLCGAVSFAYRSPTGMMNCHCTRCRLARGAAHATNVFVTQRDFEWLSGRDKVKRFKVPDAERFMQAFCGDCGSPVPRVRDVPQPDERMGIPAGCLDSDPGLSPAGHIYVGSKAPWFQFFDDLQRWEERPV